MLGNVLKRSCSKIYLYTTSKIIRVPFEIALPDRSGEYFAKIHKEKHKVSQSYILI